MNNRIFGFNGENAAVKYLKKHKYKILERNYTLKKFAEIDIIALEKNTLCFIEVKTRSTDEFGLPCQSVDIRKQKKIFDAANIYLASFNGDADIRFDVIEVFAQRKKDTLERYEINHIKNAF